MPDLCDVEKLMHANMLLHGIMQLSFWSMLGEKKMHVFFYYYQLLVGLNQNLDIRAFYQK